MLPALAFKNQRRSEAAMLNLLEVLLMANEFDEIGYAWPRENSRRAHNELLVVRAAQGQGFITWKRDASIQDDYRPYQRREIYQLTQKGKDFVARQLPAYERGLL